MFRRSPRPLGWALISLLGLALTLPSSAQITSAYVTDLVLVSSTRVTNTLTDFVYRIRVVNQGPALQNTTATVISTSANTVIRDNEVILGNVPAGTTVTSTDTFTLRQNRQFLFNPANLLWTVRAVVANTRPLANAGADQTVRTGAVVTLDGTQSSDADGQTLTYRWQIVSRPAGSTATLSNPNQPRPTFSIDRGGNYSFRLTVSDGQTDSAPDDVLVSTINSAPVADAGADRTVARSSLVTLDGGASRDPDFDGLGFAWSIVARPLGSTAELTGASTQQPTIRLDQAGSYRFQLIVSDGQLQSSPAFVSISTENSIPVADAGPNQAAGRGQRVTLDGSASRDADGDALAFLWSWAARPQGSAATLDVTDNLHPMFTPDVFGDYVVQLIVNDGGSDSVPDTVTVAVVAPPNRAPNAVADSATTNASEAVDIAVLDNDSDPDSDLLVLQNFTQPAGGQVVRVGNLLRFTPAAGFSGATSFSYVISDGALTASAIVSITVNSAANTAPTVNAGTDQAITLPYQNASMTVTLRGTVSDDGRPQPASVTSTWTSAAGNGPALITTPAARTTDVQLSAPGAYIFRLTASDGALSASDDVQVLVSAAPNSAPQLAAIADRTIDVGDSLRIQLTASDSDPFDVLTFSLGAVPIGTTLSSNDVLAWTATSPGSYSFTVGVRDVGGLTSSDTFVITARAANRPPVLGAMGDDTSYVGASYSKTLGASDPDGTAVSLSLLSGPQGLTLSGNQITWRPGANQTGGATVRVQARDAGGATAAGAFRIEVQPATPPLARDDVYAVQVGQSITIAAPGVLSNDSSADGRALSALRRSDPTFGSVTSFTAAGSFSYTAPATDPRPPFSITGRLLTTDGDVGVDLQDWTPLGDLNRDGRPDLISNRFNGFRVIATSGGSGARLWGTNPPCQFQGHSAPTDLLADLDDDGRLEYVHVARCGEGGNLFAAYSRVQALADNGSVEWTSPLVTQPLTYLRCTLAGICESTPVAIEWTDALRDIIFSTTRLGSNEAPTLLYRQYVPVSAALAYGRTPDGRIDYLNFGCQVMTGDAADFNRDCMVTVLLSSAGGQVQQVLRSTPRRNAAALPNNPYPRNQVIPVDLDGDGSLELVSGADVWRRSGSTWTIAWQSPVEPQQVIVADLDGDGRTEVIQHVNVGQSFGPNDPLPQGFSGLMIFDSSGVEIRRIPMTTTRSGTLSAADIDGDGRAELLITQGGIAYAFGSDGVLKWTYLVPDNAQSPQQLRNRTNDSTNMVAYDLDGDGNREVVLSAVGWVLFLDGRTGIEKARLDTGPRPAGDASGKVFVTDWDADGHADVVVVNQRGSYTFGSSEAGWVVNSSRNDWLPAPTFQGQSDHRATSFDANGRVLFDASAPREFRNPQQLGTVRDPRASAGTSFTYVANDGLVDSVPATVFIGIEPENRPPVITSTPPTAYLATTFRAYQIVYRVLATDPDAGDTLRYSLTGFTNAIGFPQPTINETTGEVSAFMTSEGAEYTTELYVTVTDSRGATATQSFVLNNTNAGIAAPNVVGRTVAQAAPLITAARLQYRVAQEQFSAIVPAGAVISQNPVAGGTTPRLGTVALIVSKGAQPVIVPNLIGRPVGAAGGLLTSAGFTPVVTRQYSTTVRAGIVISQSPAGGSESVPGTASVVVSAGNGIAVRLDRDFVAANQTITAQVRGIALDGSEAPVSSATLVVTRLSGPSAGPLPAVLGSTLSFTPTTRGNFLLTATDAASGRSGSADFVVGPPGNEDSRADVLAIASFGETVAAVSALMREASAAGAAGDTATMNARVRSAVQRWRVFDRTMLELSTPFAPEGGLPPTTGDLLALGQSASAEDQVNLAMLETGVARIQVLTEALRAPTTPFAEIDRRFGELVAAVTDLNRNQPGEFGLVMAQPEYRYLISRLLPDLVDALMDEMATASGVPTAGGPPARDATERIYVASTLAEELTTLAVNKALEQLDFVSQFKNDVMKQARAGAMLVGLASHLRVMLANQPLVEVVGGASLSLRRFQAPYSFVEAFDLDTKYPILNDLVFLGPETVNTVQDLTDAIRGLSFSDLSTAASTLWKLKKGIDALREAGDPLAANATQVPTQGERGCVFTTAPNCAQLQFASGFFPVYSYRAPPPLPPSVVGLPVPIIVIVRSTTGQFYLSTPPFIPYRDGVD